MSFLAPLFLLGAGAVALPLVFHLIRRTTREKTLFSSLMFLQPVPPRMTQRSRLEELLLLLLRCLALVLLALGFSRPFLANRALSDPSTQAPRQTVILLDHSASMRRGDWWKTAIARVTALAREAQPGDEIALLAFDRQTTNLVSFDEWRAATAEARPAVVLNRLATLEPGWGATHLDAALMQAAEALVETEKRPAIGERRIVLVSDLQEGSRLDALQAYEWPKDLQLVLETPRIKSTSNAGLQWVADPTDGPAPTNLAVRIRVSNATDSKVERFTLQWAQPNGPERSTPVGPVQEVLVPAGSHRIVTLKAPAEATADRIVLQGDDEPFDNTAYVVPPTNTTVQVLYFGADAPEDTRQPLSFLRRAFAGTGTLRIALSAFSDLQSPPSPAIKAGGLYVVTGALPAEAVTGLREEITAGKTAFVALRDAAAGTALAQLLNLPQLPVVEAKVGNFALLGDLDFGHPLLAPFADPRFSDFTKIHVWHYRKLDAAALPGARAIARFDSGDPAMMEVPLGRGRLVVWTTGWHPDDSQWSRSTKFVPFLYSLLEVAGATSGRMPTSLQVGDALVLADPGATGGRMRLPNQTEIALPAGTTNFTATTAPGVYEFRSGSTPERRLTFAVNLDAAESRTAVLPTESLESLGAPVRASGAKPELSAERRRELSALETEGRQKFWRWLLLATLAVLLLETAVAGWKTRRIAVQLAQT